MNENYPHPAMPEGQEKNILKGMYLFKENVDAKIQLLGSGAILREVIRAGEILEGIYNIGANIWSVTSFNELRKEGLDCDRWNTMHPLETPRKSFVEQSLEKFEGPCVAATDYMKAYADQIREFIPNTYKVLGTDGYGRSDSRRKLREHFEVDSTFIVLTALKALADEGFVSNKLALDVIDRYKINPDKINPIYS